MFFLVYPSERSNLAGPSHATVAQRPELGMLAYAAKAVPLTLNVSAATNERVPLEIPHPPSDLPVSPISSHDLPSHHGGVARLVLGGLHHQRVRGAAP
jgi:hypothetical protein